MIVNRKIMTQARELWPTARCTGCHLTGRRKGPDDKTWLWVDFSRGRGLCGTCAKTPSIVHHYKELAR
jgi:hypothetical protein